MLAAGCVPEVAGVNKVAPATTCLAPSDVVDGDDSWSSQFAGTSGCVRVDRFFESGVEWTVQTMKANRRGPLFVVPHDDEQAAFGTAAYALARYGGTLVAIETGGERRNGGIDPNRNFNAGKSRCAGPPTTRFAAAVLKSRRARQPIIALHTNKHGADARGGSGDLSILSLPDGSTPFLSASASGGLASEDAFVLVSTTDGPDSRRVRRIVERINARGVNVVVETVERSASDCSLSNYAALNGIDRYYNIEVPAGAGATQQRILDVLLAALREG